MKPRRLPTPAKMDPQMVATITTSRHQMIDLSQNLCAVSATLVYDTSQLTPRLRNAVIKNLEQGVVVGGGEASALAMNLSTFFQLGCLRLWHNTLAVDRSWGPGLREEVGGLCAADMATHLLTLKVEDTYHQTWQDRTKFIHECNRYILGLGPRPNNTRGYSYYDGMTLQFHSRDMMVQAATLTAKRRTPTTLARVASVVAALKVGRTIEFSYDHGPVTATIV